LYSLTTRAVIDDLGRLRVGLDLLPDTVIFDVIHQAYLGRRVAVLTAELAHFPTFSKLLRVRDKRAILHKMLQAATEHSNNVTRVISQAFATEVEGMLCNLSSSLQQQGVITRQRLHHSPPQVTVANSCKTLELGFNLGGFLCEAGWYPAATTVHRACRDILVRIGKTDSSYTFVKLECLSKLLHSLSSYCQFTEATSVYLELETFVWQASVTVSCYPNLASIYNEFSSHCFMKSQYHEAYTWAMKAVKMLNSNIPTKLTIDVLRQASKSCVVKREFAKADMLVKQAVSLSKEVYGTSHSKYADCLVDYGFYLLNVDCITASMQVYKNALDVRLECFGSENLQVAVAHEDLAYATYVNEYSTGKFNDARIHAETSLAILTRHLPEDHLLLASSKRVLALILEEIAIDNQDSNEEKRLLKEAELLHLFALRLAIESFGESNVQTAKHYGNLGRLYQTMQRYTEAEKMHLKAIEIKETLLGTDDYEVALSVGHLASLYNYDMMQYHKAEELYLRSIKIGSKLFGPSYSGLEYDYRGLIQVYQMTHNFEKFFEFTSTLNDWKVLRDEKDREQGSAEVVYDACHLSLPELIQTVTAIPELSSSSRLQSSSSLETQQG
jgi:tetratricopeptide (TPR) repeat protein